MSRGHFNIPTWESFAEGAIAAEEIAASLGVTLEKKDPPILGTPGYEQAVRTLIRALAKTTRGPDREAFRKAAEKLDADWPNMTVAKREEVIASAARMLVGVPELVIGKVEKTLIAKMTEIVRITKRDAGRVHRLAINPSFNARDARIIKFAAESQGNYITTRYGERSKIFKQKARDIVSSGLKDGLGRVDIGRKLGGDLIGPSLRTSEAYWETVASIHVGRSRSWGQLAGFDEAGISKYEWESVLDEVTTDQCRFLHGKHFEVSKAIEKYQEVEESDDPEAIKKIQPWLRIGKTSDGAQALFVDRGGRRSYVANVDESGVGTSDKIGSYSNGLDAALLQKLGVCTPPCHPRCRSTILPVS